MNPQQEPDYNQPVAYDKDGRPLYAHPPAQPASTPKRPVMPPLSLPSLDTDKRHEDSVRKYPTLNLSEGEYVISEVRRHPIGLFVPLLIGCFLILLVLLGLAAYPVIVPTNNPPFASIVVPASMLLLLIGLGTYIVVWVYSNNKFFLTNESVIQEIQSSLFSHDEQTVSLGNIEDVSFTQTGIPALLFNVGSIRLSTEGDDTIYRFHYVVNPKGEIALINNAIEAFKNSHPGDTDDSY